MRMVLIVAPLLAVWAGAAFAESCEQQAVAKKLSGAARTSFMTKCENDAKTSCEKSSAEKKLSGAAKKSFETKCVNEAVGKKG